MSKLNNAPLLEVVYELRWKVTNQEDLSKYQYLHGDLYSLLKDDYPIRKQLSSPEIPLGLLINSPVHQFRRASNDYPLFQIGPGIITLNTIDEKYYWDEYFQWSRTLIESFFKVYQYSKAEKFSPTLIYIDFFKLDIRENDVLEFINKNLSISLNQSFHQTQEKANAVSLGLTYYTELGQLTISLNIGKNAMQEEGLILQTQLSGSEYEADSNRILQWLTDAHEFCSNIFKEMTKGNLYESFK
ncbi:TIGR04255 family protein [Adhaeribacter pallidiroseus]|uniref:TIGR04255 family protein n=1 Tax=Adhaeribacter pallidiroseus TaxID=2072847 RepID=A0A369QRD0_9BACT|nr:TIGR04255 family protein [Adhaeribacter pallidiroseus]RDC65797.1 hypothetical protein AHMF7616_04427 [Adhaeribacter pallidiroseus]